MSIKIRRGKNGSVSVSAPKGSFVDLRGVAESMNADARDGVEQERDELRSVLAEHLRWYEGDTSIDEDSLIKRTRAALELVGKREGL